MVKQNNYEIMFILNSALDKEVKETSVEMVKEIISADGTVEKVDIWGDRRLAYPINKKNEGYYVLVNFKSSPDLPKELDRRLKISENFIRHMIINKDDK